ncbi:acyl-CoA dehydrogenase family protein [Nocardiopsis suaedae]|uniref:Acyl-CoA dehydrogenase family protein n=1 Tax=Nocardiopsis suaedae TaxID=3018444 RepID=A0ABT4TK13_9ACTN|nr:acyl-CoA dehydrogenase family protein [Nocardiopsis suaedae]MDA2805045.1 acyl-CoA dehydrogenase family protein [Nocardiopsis suaedae]
MRFRPEHADLRAGVRRLLAHHGGGAAWRLLAEQVGAPGLAVPERLGGAGYGPLEVHAVMEELGHALAEVPFLSSSVLATQALLGCEASPARDAWLGRLAEGTATATLAWEEDDEGDARNGDAPRCSATDTSGRWSLSGRKPRVLDAATADLLVVAAATGDGPALFAVAPDAEGVELAERVPLDLTRPRADVAFDCAEALPLTFQGSRVLADALTAANAALTAEQVGGAARCVEMTVGYAGTREQFGRPIGSFQAVKHRLADMYVDLESARSLSYAAAFSLESGNADAWADVSAAKSACSEAYREIAGEAIQLHGGIGVTWEHEAQRHFKRAHGSASLFGAPEWHRRRLASVIGLEDGAVDQHPGGALSP